MNLNLTNNEIQELRNTYYELSDFVTGLIMSNNEEYKIYDNLRIKYYNLLRSIDETL